MIQQPIVFKLLASKRYRMQVVSRQCAVALKQVHFSWTVEEPCCTPVTIVTQTSVRRSTVVAVSVSAPLHFGRCHQLFSFLSLLLQQRICLDFQVRNTTQQRSAVITPRSTK